MTASNGPIRQRTAMAMGQKVAVGASPTTPFSGKASKGSIPGKSKEMPTTMPFVTQRAAPKGAK